MLKLETRFVNILIGCLYRPPSAPKSFWGALDQQLEEVLGVEHPPPTLLLTGDLNVDVLDTKHPHYNHLHSFLATHNLTNHVSSPTRYSSTRNSCLDLLLCQDATLVNSCASQPTTVPTDHERRRNACEHLTRIFFLTYFSFHGYRLTMVLNTETS